MLSTDEKYMARCLHLAQFGGGYVSPNPMVGAVLVCNDRIIGEGYHRRIGEAHAEPNAIASVTDKDLLPQSTLYVNLEPCWTGSPRRSPTTGPGRGSNGWRWRC